MSSLEKYVQKIHKKLNNESLQEQKVSLIIFFFMNNKVPVADEAFNNLNDIFRKLFLFEYTSYCIVLFG